LAKSVMVIAAIQHPNQIRAFFQNDMVGHQPAGITAQSTRERRADAQHGKMIAAVGMQKQQPAVAIGTLLPVIAADIDNLADQIAQGALGGGSAEITTEAQVHEAHILRIYIADEETAEDNDAASPLNFLAPGDDVTGNALQGETCGRYLNIVSRP
jgi:hypothetical protein